MMISPPGKHDVGVGVVCAWPCGTPLDGVDLFAVGLEVVNTGLVLHTPDLWVEDEFTGQGLTGCKSQRW